ncbi:DUF4407 domain-containing protein [Methylomonas paludis]|uniref:DUF4407 domain-containing protein n=1 Tax=Methylomonas paludis TaxID=1173101 RepID=A0A975MQT7_9GAMM|nr:DUF4407 domain-containing protein [Methylomonas paludis]QWF71784.1 DUF4407 domain-containing protein [Methylomonas paludis]
MSSLIIPNTCPDCGAPTIDDRCEANCGWTFNPALPLTAPPIVEIPDKGLRKSFFDRFFNMVGSHPGPANIPAPLPELPPEPAAEPLSSSPPAALEKAPEPATPPAETLENRVGQLETRIKSADQLSKYLLNQLDHKLAIRVKEQESLIGIEAEKAVQHIKPAIQTELHTFIREEVSLQTEPVVAEQLQKIEAANTVALSNIVQQQVERKLVAEELDSQVEQRVQHNFQQNFARQFQESLDKLLLTDQDYVEIKKKVVSRSTTKPGIPGRDKAWYWLSGTSVELLEHCPESEIKKYQALGISMLMPMLMGFFACLHLAEQHFTSETLASHSMIIGLSLVWTLFIMAIDRILLVSYRVSGQWQVKIVQFGWRFFIALLFALIFDASFLPTLYHSDVQAVINNNRKIQLDELGNKLSSQQQQLFGLPEAEDLLSADHADRKAYERLKAELDAAGDNIKVYAADRQAAIADASCEINGGPACQKGIGAKFNAAKLREDAANERLENAKLHKQLLENQLHSLYEKTSARENILAELKTSPAYHDRKKQAEAEYELAGKDILASNPREETKIVFDLFKKACSDGDWLTAATFLAYLILFILVDTFPIIMKILMPRGMYDNLLEAQDQAIGAKNTGPTQTVNGNIVTTGFRQTDLGFEITEITARFAVNKSYTAWQVIQNTLEAQLDHYIRANWKNHGSARSSDPDKSGFAVYTLSCGTPPLS